MHRLVRVLLLVLVSTSVYARGAEGQVRAPGPDRAALRAAVESADAARTDAARRWAAERGVGLRGRGVAGRPVALVGVDGRRPIYLTVHNDAAALTTGTAHLHPGGRLGLGLTGRGLVLGLWDAGHALSAHREFGGRVTAGDAAAPDDHATHVAGTLVAAGREPRARGMAFAADLRTFDWTHDATEMMREAAGGLLLSNHSYGAIAGWYFGALDDEEERWYWFGDPGVSSSEDYLFGWYGVEAAQYDRAVYANPYFLPVVAAGNDRGDRPPASGSYAALDASGAWRTYDVATTPRARDGGDGGFDTIAGAAVAKNVLTVGSARPGGDGVRASAFSAFGPTDDGRVKPDLVGHGEHVYSTLAGGPDRYGVSSGTSMATPNVAGTLLLLQEHAEALRGTPLRAATLKALALHTARDLGAAGPDYATGWGMLDAEAAARHLASAPGNPAALTEAALAAGSVFTTRVHVDGDVPLRVTLAWTDPPSARLPIRGAASLDDPTPHLRHDLDLEVIDAATGAVYRPYVLDPRRPDAPAVPGDNRLDPVEQVFVTDAPPGEYVVRVSHKGVLDGPEQPFALLVSGASDGRRAVALGPFEAVADEDAVVLTWTTLFEQATGTVRVERAPVTYASSGARTVGAFGVVGRVPLDAPAPEGDAYAFRDEGLLAGRYAYRLVYTDGLVEEPLGEAEANVVPPQALAVLSAYPNPFADVATVVLDLPERQRVRVAVFDALGRRVAHVADATLDAGRHRLAVDGAAWAPGVYLVRVETPRGVQSYRLVRVGR